VNVKPSEFSEGFFCPKIYTQRSRRYKEHKEGSEVFVRYIIVKLTYYIRTTTSDLHKLQVKP